MTQKSSKKKKSGKTLSLPCSKIYLKSYSGFESRLLSPRPPLSFSQSPQAGLIPPQCITIVFCFNWLTVICWSYFEHLPLPLITNPLKSRARIVVFLVLWLLAQYHKQIIQKEHVLFCLPSILSPSYG